MVRSRDRPLARSPAHRPIEDLSRVSAILTNTISDKANPLKSKGLGELGICGAGAALANAIHNATGVRIRDYPMTLDRVLKGLEEQEGRGARRS